MKDLLPKSAAEWADNAADFAKKHLAGRLELRGEAFPFDVWRHMADAGLLALGVPEQYGGKPGGRTAMAAAMEAFVREGGPLGLGMSWALNLLVAGYVIGGFGNDSQKSFWIPDLARGRATGCLAISEPVGKGHPAKMKTTAEKSGGAFIINGEKTYLTNGPIADLYVVMAVTGENSGKKEITAFLVERNAPGLYQTEPIHLGFMQPCPHGGIRLENVSVPAGNVLGPIGRAYENMIRPFRAMEDAVLMGPMAGGLARLLDLTARLAKTKKSNAAEDLAKGLGRMETRCHLARALAFRLAEAHDAGLDYESFWPLLPAGRDVVDDFLKEFRTVLTESDLKAEGELEILARDIEKTNGIARGVLMKKQTKRGFQLL